MDQLKDKKTMFVAKRFTQIYVAYYYETFTPVAKMNTFVVILSLAGNYVLIYNNLM